MTTTPTTVVENPTDGPGPAAGACPAPAAGGGETADVRELTYAEAVRETLGDLMENDERVFLMGEDIGVYGGAFGVTTGLLERFGRERVRDTPISEIAIVGAGSAPRCAGCARSSSCSSPTSSPARWTRSSTRPPRSTSCWAAQLRCRWSSARPPGSGTGAAAQHSQSLEAWFAHVPGIKVVMPATPADAAGLLRAAVDDPNPVLVLEHKLLYKQKGEVPARPLRAAGQGRGVPPRQGPDHRRDGGDGRQVARRRGGARRARAST